MRPIGQQARGVWGRLSRFRRPTNRRRLSRRSALDTSNFQRMFREPSVATSRDPVCHKWIHVDEKNFRQHGLSRTIRPCRWGFSRAEFLVEPTRCAVFTSAILWQFG